VSLCDVGFRPACHAAQQFFGKSLLFCQAGSGLVSTCPFVVSTGVMFLILTAINRAISTSTELKYFSAVNYICFKSIQGAMHGAVVVGTHAHTDSKHVYVQAIMCKNTSDRHYGCCVKYSYELLAARALAPMSFATYCSPFGSLHVLLLALQGVRHLA